MSKSAKNLFSKEQTERIVEAVKVAERNTSAEIRVHIENHCAEDPLDRAVAVFVTLGMEQTELRNGVLIYIAVKDHKIAIIGDAGVNKNVSPMFWNECYAVMREDFVEGDFTRGIVRAIDMIEKEVKRHFPYREDNVNHLPDDISFGDN